jgi:hypothetical protein
MTVTQSRSPSCVYSQVEQYYGPCTKRIGDDSSEIAVHSLSSVGQEVALRLTIGDAAFRQNSLARDWPTR